MIILNYDGTRSRLLVFRGLTFYYGLHNVLLYIEILFFIFTVYLHKCQIVHVFRTIYHVANNNYKTL